MINNKRLIILLLIVSAFCSGYFCFASYQKIFVSQNSGNDDNDGSSELTPIKTLCRAKEIARTSSAAGFCILLKGGDVFDDFTVTTNQILTEYDPGRKLFAFIWDINKPLVFSTYGLNETATLYSGKYSHQGGPQTAIAITWPSSQNVIIENIHFEKWQLGAIFTYKTKNIRILNNVIEKIGTLYFPNEKNLIKYKGVWIDLYAAGAIYPKCSDHIIIKGNTIKDIHNKYNDSGKLHAFYISSANDVEISNNFVINASGPPLKFRREGTNHVLVENNEFHYTGPSKNVGEVEEGWVRYAGDANEGCPHDIVIKNNRFCYPYCWQNISGCQKGVAIKCSVDNPMICGSNACNDKIEWINNSFKYIYPEAGGADSVDLKHHTKANVSDSNAFATMSNCQLLKNSDNISNHSLVSWYRFDEKSGIKAFDSSGNSFDAIVSKNTAWDAGGHIGGCLSFDGTVNVLAGPKIFSNIENEITICLWVCGNPKQLMRYHCRVFHISGQVFPGQPRRKISALIPDNTAKDACVLWQSGSESNYDSLLWHVPKHGYWSNQWNHYAFLKDANKGIMKIYHNGSLVAARTNAFQPMTGAKRLYIGAKRSGRDQYYGKIDDFRIYNYALSQTEIMELVKQVP